MKRLGFVVLCLILILSTLIVSQVVAEENVQTAEWTFDAENAEVASFVSNKDGFYMVASIGPVYEEPTGTIAGQDEKTVTDYAIFYVTVPEGTTMNRLYLLGNCASGAFNTTAYVNGIGADAYVARVNKLWYRVSPTNMNIPGGTTIALTVILEDEIHPYNIVLLGRH